MAGESFQPDSESVALAKKLTDVFMRDVEGENFARPYDSRRTRAYASEVGVEAPLHDVPLAVSHFSSIRFAARETNESLLCVRLDDGTSAPVGFDFFLPNFAQTFGGIPWPRFPYPDPFLWRELIRWWRQNNEYSRSSLERDDFLFLSVKEATGMFRNGLENFLSFRIAGFRHWREWMSGREGESQGRRGKSPSGGGSGRGGVPRPPSVSPGGGLSVQVSSLTHGLRLHVSPAYFITWTYFGAPTTPVSGTVMPGRYVFAGDGPMLPQFTVDNGVFRIPPDYHPSLNKF